jgi:hypothetical protein
MKAPPYVWSCHACGTSNQAGQAKCSQCGLPAIATGKAIAQQIAHLRPESPAHTPQATDKKHFADDWMLLLPEAAFAGVVVLALPFWAVGLLSKGEVGSAISLLGLCGAGIGLGFYAWRVENKWLLYLGVLLVLVGAWSAL